MDNNKIILSIMNLMLSKHRDKLRFGSLGYCGFFSLLLKEELIKRNINAKILKCKTLSNTKEGIEAYNAVKKHILSFPDIASNDYPIDKTYIELKKAFILNKEKLPIHTGHCIIIVDNVIYDPTSGQFDLPNIYSLDTLFKLWDNVNYCDLTLDLKEDFLISNQIKIGDSLKTIFSKPSFTKW